MAQHEDRAGGAERGCVALNHTHSECNVKSILRQFKSKIKTFRYDTPKNAIWQQETTLFLLYLTDLIISTSMCHIMFCT
jgi:hypothetical protein